MSATGAFARLTQMTVLLDLLNNDPREKMRPDRQRHPEKANRPDTPVLSKPAWIRVKAPGSADWAETKRIVRENKLETVPSKYLTVRPGARYFHSVRLLQRVKELDAQIFTKSGIMVGLGEERSEVLQLMDDLRSAHVDFLTIGQYLQPTRKHHAVA